ncbi:hypothetical protein FNW52_02455 [Flavobacterium sp. ZT3R18]|uniref:cytochrome C oxidase subunit IV family protein n=1 Tax=Flavobacterium sp. ZT3R18 TaxID=2594429 RepID=UPI00117A39A2|nr:cytochrome C oxidase subunit IV family protein [Flavobacterium sp. ZT3R18]TRX38927.1 hypothetical protein FNW52_02455 [Flavobacterium sp. ZT3R18]
MKKSLILIYAFLLVMTITTALIANSSLVSTVMVALILVLSSIKFFMVAFQFMELKKAHSFWKISLIMTLGLLIVVIIGLK